MLPWAHVSPETKWQIDGSAVFPGLTSVSDRQTDRQTDHATQSVTIGRICVHSTAIITSGQSNLT